MENVKELQEVAKDMRDWLELVESFKCPNFFWGGGGGRRGGCGGGAGKGRRRRMIQERLAFGEGSITFIAYRFQ